MDLKETITEAVKNIDIEEVKKQAVAHKDDILNVIEKTPLKGQKETVSNLIDKLV